MPESTKRTVAHRADTPFGEYTILNLGCGTKSSPRCVNIDWSFYLRFKGLPFSSSLAPLVFRGDRLTEYRKLADNIIVHDLSRGIPYPDQSVDAVYHSHFLEHIDRHQVAGFLLEVRRVLKRGGIQRVVVPDLERVARQYLDDLDSCRNGRSADHDKTVCMLIYQMVQKEASGTTKQPPVRRWLETKLLGDARKRGQTHQWMYDEGNLTEVLQEAGFGRVRIMPYNESAIPDWNDLGLDLDDCSRQYKPESIYVEAISE
jgi:SAM-dependent methyltransferase